MAVNLEQKKKKLFDELLEVALSDSMSPNTQHKKLEQLHKRINAIVRYQTECVPCPKKKD